MHIFPASLPCLPVPPSPPAFSLPVPSIASAARRQRGSPSAARHARPHRPRCHQDGPRSRSLRKGQKVVQINQTLGPLNWKKTTQRLAGWWFQPVLKISYSQIGNLPQGVKIKNIWNHQLDSKTSNVQYLAPNKKEITRVPAAVIFLQKSPADDFLHPLWIPVL